MRELNLLLLPYAALLFSSVSFGDISKRDACYGQLGCFPPVGESHRVPLKPEQVQTTFRLYVRSNNTLAIQFLATLNASDLTQKIKSSHFDKQKESKVIIHGFSDSAEDSWIIETKDEILKKDDVNVFTVDWSKGSKTPDYDQAAASSLLVAAQLASFLNTLKDNNFLDLSKVHLIGHSLGAHISGNAGSKVDGVGRITGLDPAEPRFNKFDAGLRLDKSDATFVDVIHTDGEPFTGTKGYGWIEPSGHADFYPNGGTDQPGCVDSELAGILGLLGHDPDKAASCSHGRAHRYFTESINSKCKFIGFPCANWTLYEQNGCSRSCPSAGCPVMGYDATKSAGQGNFFFSTSQTSPYCGYEYYVEMDLTAESINSNGRIFITLLGSNSNGSEVEFSRDNRLYQASQKEQHIIAVPKEVTPLGGVRVRFQRAREDITEQPLGADNHVTVHRIVVEDLTTKTRTIFCTMDSSLKDKVALTFTSISGC